MDTWINDWSDTLNLSSRIRRHGRTIISSTHGDPEFPITLPSGAEPDRSHRSIKHQLIYYISEFTLIWFPGFAQVSGGQLLKVRVLIYSIWKGSVKSKCGPLVIPQKDSLDHSHISTDSSCPSHAAKGFSSGFLRDFFFSVPNAFWGRNLYPICGRKLVANAVWRCAPTDSTAGDLPGSAGLSAP